MPHELNDTGITLRQSATSSNEAVGVIELPWYGKRYTVEVIFEDADDGTPNQIQVQTFCNLISRWDELLNDLTAHVVDHWTTELEQTGQMPGHEGTPPLELQIGANTELTGIVVAAMNGEGWCNYVGLLAECTWSPEHGLGIKVIDGAVAEVGYQDVVT